MMWPLLLFLAASAVAQDELDLSSIRKLEEKLPSYDRAGIENTDRTRSGNKWNLPSQNIQLKKILEGETSLGSINKGVRIVRIEDNQAFITSRPIFIRFYQLEDEHGFKYLVNKDGTTSYKVDTKLVEPIANELALTEPPTKYTPAPLHQVRAEYDKKLTLLPEVSFYIGPVMGDYMKDLFNDSKARSGISTQYGAHLFTEWSLPLKIGGVVHYESTIYGLTGGGKAHYSSLSFGPQLKTKNFEFSGRKYRGQLQLRIGPMAKVEADQLDATRTIEFNSTDLLVGLEHPIKNKFGELVFSAFYQMQWLNIKNQTEATSIRATNKTNKSLGLSIAQVFE